jgi:hypothetical protein
MRYASKLRPVVRLWCMLTDHRYTDPPESPEPFCRRCGYSGYWPIRGTIGGILERLAARLRWRSEDVPW